MRLGTLAILIISMSACTASKIDSAIDYHQKAAPYVQLGMSESSFTELMQPALVATSEERKPTRFSRGQTMYVVHYIRVARVPDDLQTDDEYQPYTFANGKLAAVGWEFLGGEKFTSQELQLRRAAANKTNVNVRQSTTVNNGSNNGAFSCVPDLNGDGRCFGGKCC